MHIRQRFGSRRRGQALVIVVLLLPVIFAIVWGMYGLLVTVITIERVTSVAYSIAVGVNNDFNWQQAQASTTACPPVYKPGDGPTWQEMARTLRTIYADRPLVPDGWASIRTVDDLYARIQVTTVCGTKLTDLPPACLDRLAAIGWSRAARDEQRRIQARITCVTLPAVQIDIPFPFLPDPQVPITVVAVSTP